MTDPKTLPEFFLELWTDRETGELVSSESYASPEALVLAIYRDSLPRRFSRRERQVEFTFVVTTHARDATAECNTVLRRMYEVADGLASFGVPYQTLDTLAQNVERLTYCEANDYPRKLPGFY